MRIVFLLLGSMLAAAANADHIELASDIGAAGRIQLEGEVIDYTGRAIRIRMPNGLEKSFAGERVIEIDAAWLAPHAQADAAWNDGDVPLATKLYGQAISADDRVWVRRLLLSRLVYCLWTQGQTEQAAERFLALVSSDPETPYFGALPLAWDASEAVSKATANNWLGRNGQPIAMLLGASHLLATDERPVAAAALEKLETAEDPRVAALAAAQLWRLEAFRASAAQADGWQSRIEQMPLVVRAGPYFLLGQTFLRQKRAEAGALALMHVPILYPDARPLAAASLLAAGEALASLNQIDQAAGLFREAERSYPQTQWQTVAVERLKALRPPEPRSGIQ